jgi:hypothetical protein
MTDERLRDAYEAAMAARRGPDRVSCPSPELLHALVRREGPEAVRLMTLDHAMACPHCRGEVELLRALRLAGEPAGSVPRRRPRWAIGVGAALAASLAVAVALGPGRAAWDRERDDVMRGSGSALWLAAPGDGEVVPSHAPIAFAWHPGRGARDYVVELLAPDGGVVLTGTTPDSALTLVPAAPLAPGEYRWVVRARLADGTGQISAARSLRVR